MCIRDRVISLNELFLVVLMKMCIRDRLISIDSAADSELKNENGYMMTAQKSWLDSVLQTNTKKWVIITTHLPFYSSKENRDNKFLRKHFQPILEKHKVDLVLSGHDHAYARGRRCV